MMLRLSYFFCSVGFVNGCVELITLPIVLTKIQLNGIQ